MTAGPHQTIFTVAQLVDAEPALTKGGIRGDLFHRDTNGLEASGAVIYRGRKILIHCARYMKWLENKPGNQKTGFSALTIKEIKKKMLEASLDKEDMEYQGQLNDDLRWHQ